MSNRDPSPNRTAPKGASVDEREFWDGLEGAASAESVDAWVDSFHESKDPLDFAWPVTHFDSESAAHRAGFLDGVLSSLNCDLNPWNEPNPSRFLDEPVLSSLRADWTRTANDFWRAIEDLRDQLDELPDEVRDRLVDLISDHLKGRSRRGR